MKKSPQALILLWSLSLTLFLEGITCILRFGCHLESSRDTAATIGVVTLGIRIHHGYVGVLILLLSVLCRRKTSLFRWAAIVGLALVLSDVLHHFAVLWPIVGSPEFDLIYNQR